MEYKFPWKYTKLSIFLKWTKCYSLYKVHFIYSRRVSHLCEGDIFIIITKSKYKYQTIILPYI